VHKLWFSLGLALLVGTLTLIAGFLSDVRLSSILFRFLISLVVFGLGGYILATLTEKFAIPALVNVKSKGQKIDIISEQELVSENNTEDNSFIPLTPDNLENIPKPKD
jgi:hypothetical protein